MTKDKRWIRWTVAILTAIIVIELVVVILGPGRDTTAFVSILVLIIAVTVIALRLAKGGPFLDNAKP